MLYLSKGDKLDLTKDNPGLSLANFALGWKASMNGKSFDLDAFAIALRNRTTSPADEDFLYFNSNKRRIEGTSRMEWIDKANPFPYIYKMAMKHSGDELVGGRDGDDEIITVDLDRIPSYINLIVFCVNIYDADTKGQKFKHVKDAFIRVDDAKTDTPVATFNLTESASNFNGVVMGYLERLANGEWDFTAKGVGQNGDMNEFMENILIHVR